MGGGLIASRTDRTTCTPSGVTSPISSSHDANGCMFVELSNAGNTHPLSLSRSKCAAPSQAANTLDHPEFSLSLSLSHTHTRTLSQTLSLSLFLSDCLFKMD